MSLELLADSHGPLTRQLAYMLGGDVDAAEDVRQEALLRAWRRLPPDLDPMAQRAWLARTARNLAIDELRRRSRSASVPLDLADAGAFKTDPVEPNAAAEALSELSPHERFVLLLRFEGGLSHAEIGSLLGLTEAAARKRTSRARSAFLRTYRRARSGQRPLVLLLSRGEETDPYVQWLERVGAEVRITQQPGERDLALADALVFSGAFDDLHPALYGERPRPVLRGRQDLERDRSDYGIVATALSLSLPLVGVCRGHQLLNLASGGSLYQDVVSDGATRETHTDGVHPVETLPDTEARGILGRRSHVHSEHHQAVRRLGRKLRVASRAPDGLVETIERTDGSFALGLQWHPERGGDGGSGERVAEALVDAARRRAA